MAFGNYYSLPDAYSRGRIIGDYRGVDLSGCDRLIEDNLNVISFTVRERVLVCL